MLSEDQMRDMLPSCYPEKTNTVNSLLPYCYTKKSPTVVQNSPARAQIQAEYLIYTEAFKKPQNRRDMSTIPVIFTSQFGHPTAAFIGKDGRGGWRQSVADPTASESPKL